MAKTTVELVPELLEAGVHFGHQTKTLEPEDEAVHLSARKNQITSSISIETVKQLHRATEFLPRSSAARWKNPFSLVQEAGAGSDQEGTHGVSALAGRDVDQSDHHPQEHWRLQYIEKIEPSPE